MGGKSASLSARNAAKDIVHFALLNQEGPNDGFFRFRKPIPW